MSGAVVVEGVGMVEVRRVLDAIGATLLTAVRVGADRAVRDVVIVEPGHEDEIRAGDLVLGVGVTVHAARELVAVAARSRAAAVLLKPPYATEPAVTKAAETGGVTLVEVRQQVSWAQLVWLLRSVLDAGDVYHTRDTGVFHDLFALADAVAAVVDAPVTIEDAHSRVLAYSARQDRADPARLSTIIGRRVPDDVLHQFRAKGVFRKLGKGTEPVFVPGQPDGTLPRLIVPIRAGEELLGSIWAIVPGPVPPERAQAFADTAAVVALHLLRLRAQADIARRATSDRLRAVLEGGEAAPAAAEELGLREGPYRVVALEVHAGDAEGRRLALWESISRHHGWRRPLVAELAGVLFAVVSERGGPAESGTWPWLRRVIADVAHDEPDLLVAAGGLAGTVAELPTSRAQAEEVLRLLAGGALRGPVVAYDDVWATLVLHRATGAVPLRELVSGGPLPVLLAHDAEHGTRYVETLRAWLERQGDPTAASRQLHIHPNTFRYRMKRLLEVTPIDLASPEVRLALSVQLAALRLHREDVVPGEQGG